MFGRVKKSLRISNNVFDDEITDLIESALADLRLAGIFFTDETDPLIVRAVNVYCKANFGYDNVDADRFNHSYLMLKQHLSFSGDYRKVVS